MKTSNETPIAATIVEQASHWLMLQWSGELDKAQQRRFAEWRNADPEHARAWQRLEHLQHTLSGVSADTALAVLREQPDARRRQTLKLLSALLLAGGSGYIVQSQLPWREAMADLRSGTGERLQRTLADGSRLGLNSGSAVDIQFSASERRIPCTNMTINARSTCLRANWNCARVRLAPYACKPDKVAGFPPPRSVTSHPRISTPSPGTMVG